MRFSRSTLATLFFLAVPKDALAFTRFDPQCTFPVISVNFVSGPPIRGVLGIIWTCLATVITCTYSVLHLNVPDPHESWHVHRLKEIGWTLITMVAPEIILAKTTMDFFKAKRALNGLRKHREASRFRRWTLAHMMYGNMGGFVYTTQVAPGWTPPTCQLTADDIRHAVCQGRLPDDPPISKAHIMGKSKSDIFAKVVTIGQLLYFCTELVVRAARKLAVTQLEIAVAGFAVCSVITYFFALSKPKGVNEASSIMLTESRYESLVHMLENDGAVSPDKPRSMSRRMSEMLRSYQVHFTNNPFHEGEFTALLLVSGTSVVLGAIHLIAWNFTFPNPTERWLWNISALVSASVLPLGVPIALVGVFVDRMLHGKDDFESEGPGYYVGGLIFSGCCVLYVGSRLVIIVEMIRCLFYLPPAAFVATWTNNFPHFG